MIINHRGSPIASTHDVLLVQEAMKLCGLYHGPIDGIPGSATMQAVREYKRRHRFRIDNSLDDDFIEHVRQST